MPAVHAGAVELAAGEDDEHDDRIETFQRETASA